MASSRILDSRYFDNISANRLEALSIKSDNIKNGTSSSGPVGPVGPVGPSFLFSLLLKEATFTPNTTGGTLTFDLPLHSGDNVIMFSDRPFRQTSFISFTEFITYFTSDNSNNSFEKDPPNAVLVHSEEQRTYIVRYSSKDSTTVTFNLELLAGETNVSLEVISGRMNLFVDSLTNATTFANAAQVAVNKAKIYAQPSSIKNVGGRIINTEQNLFLAGFWYSLAGLNYYFAAVLSTGTDIATNYALAGANYVLAGNNYALKAEQQNIAVTDERKYFGLAIQNYNSAAQNYNKAGENSTGTEQTDNYNLAGKYSQVAQNFELEVPNYNLLK